MDQVWVHRYWVAIACAFGWLGLIVSPPAFAQITPDNTLGNENSRVNRNVQVRGGNADRIDGGATRGRNLFHSFREFNVNEGQRVYFANPSGVENILGRVTGTDVSDIMGTLGVDGGANLFMLNPNGIIFGPNARLDVSGSFTASTADSFTFADGSLFSATSPGDASLLSVAVPLGVQYGANPPGAILNAGALSVGHNFKLSGGSVTSTGQLSAPNGALVVEGVAGDVRVRQASAQTATLSASNNLVLQDSQLQTLGDLNLLAGNTVQARDSVANPFIAYAGGNLTVQGNQNIDIFALNHPSSGLVSGGDMVLRSTNTVGGDAHYWAGGNFRIEQLDSSPGNLFSPYDPIIRSAGDVVFGDYTGASLHIFAGGSVTAGNITITGADTTNGLLPETITLSNPIGTLRPGDQPTTVTINGRTTPTLDIRAGTTAVGTPSVTPNPVPGINPPGLTTTDQGTRADITIGSIQNPGGTVFLTNQYQPASNLPQDGIIRVGNIDTSVETGNAGSVVLNAAGTIELKNAREIEAGGGITARMVITSQTDGGGNGGNVTLVSRNGNIDTRAGGIYTQIRDGNNTGGEGGSVYIVAQDDIDAGTINAGAELGGAGAEGSIELVSRGGDINTYEGTLFSDSRGDRSGPISLYAQGGNITIGSGGINLSINSSDGGEAGDISIQAARNVTLRGVIFDNVESGRGQAGNIDIQAPELTLKSGSQIQSLARASGTIEEVGRNRAGNIRIATDVLTVEGGLITARVSENNGVGSREDDSDGNILLQSYSGRSLEINLQQRSSIDAQASGPGDGGSIKITTPDSATVELNLAEDSQISASSVSGTSGNIDLQGLNVLDVRSGGRIIASTETGRAGDIRINTDNSNLNNSVEISGINSRIAAEATGAGGRAGDVTIDARQVTVSNDASISTSSISPPKGEGSSFGNIDLQGLDELIVEAGGEITASTETGQAGNITIDANDAVRVRNDGRIVVEANRNGGAPGNIKISTNELVVNNGEISASGTSGGSRGNITISASDAVRVENNGRIAVEANRNGGVAGSIRIRTERLRLDNGEISVAATGRGGRAGTIDIRARDARLRNNSQITAATGPSGQGGEIVLRGRDRSRMRSLRVLNSEIAARTVSGPAGDLRIRAVVL